MFGYPYCIDKLLKKPTVPAIRSYLSINDGTPTYINGSQGSIVFSNSHNVSWTFNNSTIVASATFPGGAGGVAVSAGTESQSTGTVIFSNSNGITFGLNAGTITAAHNALTSQSNQAASASNGSFTFQTLSFTDANNVTFGTSAGGIIFASVAPPGAGSVNFSAGTTSNNLASVTFADSNNITFGLNAGIITASVFPPLDEIDDPNNDAVFLMGTRQIQFQWGTNLSAFTTAAARQGLFEIDVIGGTGFATDSTTHAEVLHIHQSSNNPYLHLLHLEANGTNATPLHIENAGAIGMEINSPISFDGGSVPLILGTSQSNLVSNLNAFYLEGARSSQFLTSQSNQAASASNGSFTFQTLNFSNASNVTFGTSAGGIIFASVAAQSAQPVAASASNGSFLFSTLAFSNANNVTFGTSAGSIITASVAAPGGGDAIRGIAAGVSTATTNTVNFSNANGISFGFGAAGNSTVITASHDALTSQSNQAASASNGSFTFQTLNFSNANNVTFGTSAGGIITASVNTGGGGGVTVSEYYPPWAFSQRATNSSFGQNTLYFAPFDVYQNISGSRINFYISINQSISAGNSTGTCYGVFGYGLYTRNASTLSLLTSYRLTVYSVSHSSNTQINVTHYIGLSNATSHSTISTGLSTSNATTYLATRLNGQRVLPLPLNLTLTPGRYWLGVANSTISGNAMTNALSVQGTSVGLQVAAVAFGTNSVASGGAWLRPQIGWGTLQTTSAGFPNTIAYTTNDIAATGNVTLPHFDIVGYTTGTNMI